MLVELYILFQIITIGFFIGSYFLRYELFWAITILMSMIMMVSSYDIQLYDKAAMDLISFQFPFILSINLLFFSLSAFYLLIDIFDKYGTPLFTK